MALALAIIGAGIGVILGLFVAEREGGDYNFAAIAYVPAGGLIGALIGAAVGTFAF